MPDGTTLPPALPLGNGWLLDAARQQVVDAAGRPVPLRRRSFAVLQALVRRSGRIVPAQELLDAVWGHAAVTPDNVTQCVGEIRRALGDRDGRLLRTVHDRGYLFDPPACPAPPSIAVLPFGGPGGVGFAGEVAVELQRRGVGGVRDGLLAGGRADWLLAGALRRVGPSLRVTARLASGTDGALAWGERYDCDLAPRHRLAAESAMVADIAAAVAAVLAGPPREAGAPPG